MKDHTEIFTKAIEKKEQYDFETVRRLIDAHDVLQCGDWDDWADDRWYRLCPKKPCGYDKCYGFISAAFPVALVTKNCPEDLKKLLDENGILHTELEEPMSCDEDILRQFVPGCVVFDESFMESGDLSFDDERFFLYNQKLDTGHKGYIDAGCFTMEEIR